MDKNAKYFVDGLESGINAMPEEVRKSLLEASEASEDKEEYLSRMFVGKYIEKKFKKDFNDVMEDYDSYTKTYMPGAGDTGKEHYKAIQRYYQENDGKVVRPQVKAQPAFGQPVRMGVSAAGEFIPSMIEGGYAQVGALSEWSAQRISAPGETAEINRLERERMGMEQTKAFMEGDPRVFQPGRNQFGIDAKTSAKIGYYQKRAEDAREELYRRDQGMESLPRMREYPQELLFKTISDSDQMVADLFKVDKKQVTEAIDKNLKEQGPIREVREEKLHGTFLRAYSEEAQENAKWWRELRDEVYDYYEVDPEFRNSMVGGLIKTGVDMMGYMSTGMLGKFRMPAIQSQMFALAEDEARKAFGENFDAVEGFWTRFASSTAQAKVESLLGLERRLTESVKALKVAEGARKITAKEFATNFVKRGLVTGAEEGLEEPIQGFIDDLASKMTHDPERELLGPEAWKKRLLEASMGFAFGFLFGGGIGGLQDIELQGRSRKYITNRLGQPLSKEDFTLMRQFKTDQEIREGISDPVTGEMLVKAVNGDVDAQKQYNAQMVVDSGKFVPTFKIGAVQIGEYDGNPVMVSPEMGAIPLDLKNPKHAQLWDRIQRYKEEEELIATVSPDIDAVEAEEAANEFYGTQAERVQVMPDGVGVATETIPEPTIGKDKGTGEYVVYGAGDVEIARGKTQAEAEEKALSFKIQESAKLGQDLQEFLEYFEFISGIEADVETDAPMTYKRLIEKGRLKEERAREWIRKTTNFTTTEEIEWALENSIILGSSLSGFKRKVWVDTIRIYRGASYFTVIEEYSESYLKGAIERDGDLTWDQVQQWKLAYEERTGLHEYGNDEDGLTEWWSNRVIDYLTGRVQEEESRDIPPGFKRFLIKFQAYIKHILARATKLMEMRRQGLLDPEFERHLEQSAGLNPKYVEMKVRAIEQEQDGPDPSEELSKVVKRLGGIISPARAKAITEGIEGTEFAGELREVWEEYGKGRGLSIFRKDGSTLDRMITSLRGEGFTFETPSDLIEALKESARGNPVYPDYRGVAEDMRANGSFMTAYHGSPHAFDRFTTEKIGTGEGAQAYGWGLYFAGNKEVAEWYRDKLSAGNRTRTSIRVDGNLYDWEKLTDYIESKTSLSRQHAGYLANDILWAKDGDALVQGIKKHLRYNQEVIEGEALPILNMTDDQKAKAIEDAKQLAPAYKEQLRFAESASIDFEFQKGKLYQVDLKPSEDEYLLWDKPLSEQSEKVRKALLDQVEGRLQWMSGEDTGGNIYRTLSGKDYSTSRLSDKGASMYLKSLGIRGIKFLDGPSRGKGDGSYNYVIFDEADVEIEDTFMAVPLSEDIANFKAGWQASGLGVWVHESSSGHIVLSQVSVPPSDRKKGIGTAFMNELIGIADKHGRPIALTPDTAYGASSVGRLKKFYKRFGFVENKGANKDFGTVESMVRQPKAQPTFMAVPTDTPAFKAWFGKSKVVDENGEPLVVYHGTKIDGIDKFEAGEEGGIFFSNDQWDAETYGDKIHKVYLSISNPWEISWSDIFSEEGEVDPYGKNPWVLGFERIKEWGYDGIIIKADPELADRLDEHEIQYDQYIAFSPTQIKSATGNRGTFDPADPRITFMAVPTDTPAFRNWFKDSKVVDEDGEPLVMYHSSVEDFEEFRKDKIRAMDYDAPVNGFWFSSDPNTSPAMTGGNFTKAVYLRVENPAPEPVWKKVSREVVGKSQQREGARSYHDETRLQLQEMGYDGIIWADKPRLVATENPDVFKIEGTRYGKNRTLRYSKETVVGPDGKSQEVEGWDYYSGYELVTGYESKEDFLEMHSEKVVIAFEPTQIKSATGNRGTFDPTDPRITFSAVQDQQYMEAVNSGDMETAQKMVNRASRMAGRYPGRWFHGQPSKEKIEVFDPSKGRSFGGWNAIGTWFTLDRKQAETFSKFFGEDDKLAEGNVYESFLMIQNPLDLATVEEDGFDRLVAKFKEVTGKTTNEATTEDVARFREALISEGYDSIILTTEKDKFKKGDPEQTYAIVLNPEQIKSADPVTYDDQGNVIPLSQRFDPNDPRITFMAVPTDTPAFKAWFAGSKVVDENGQPRVVYRGMKADVSILEPQGYDSLIFFTPNPELASDFPIGYNNQPEWVKAKEAEYRQRSKDWAETIDWDAKRTPEEWDAVFQQDPIKQYFWMQREGGRAVYPVYLKAEKPFDPRTDLDAVKDEIPGYKEADRKHWEVGSWVHYENPKVVAYLKSKGHDAIWISEDTRPGKAKFETIAVFSPTQIKSATGNRGTFDPTDPRITFSAVPYNLIASPFIENYDGEKGEPVEELDFDSLHYHVTLPARKRIKEAIDSGAVRAASDKLVTEVKEMLKIADVASGEGWYSRMRERIKKVHGEFSKLFTHLLGATSAQTPVDDNFTQAVEIITRYKRGEFDSKIKKYIEMRQLLERGELEDALVKRKIATKDQVKGKTEAALAGLWISHYDLLPKKATGALYNANSGAVLKALSGKWLEGKVTPKTPQFAMNLNGESLEATIDVWAARTLRRLLWGDENRIQPSDEQGVSDEDFALGQIIFREAAKKLGYNPDDLQAIVWFGEKHIWDMNGWTSKIGAKKSSFDEAAEAFYPVGRKARPYEHGKNVLKFMNKESAYLFDKETEGWFNSLDKKSKKYKNELTKRRKHEKEYLEAKSLPGVPAYIKTRGQGEADREFPGGLSSASNVPAGQSVGRGVQAGGAETFEAVPGGVDPETYKGQRITHQTVFPRRGQQTLSEELGKDVDEIVVIDPVWENYDDLQLEMLQVAREEKEKVLGRAVPLNRRQVAQTYIAEESGFRKAMSNIISPIGSKLRRINLALSQRLRTHDGVVIRRKGELRREVMPWVEKMSKLPDEVQDQLILALRDNPAEARRIMKEYRMEEEFSAVRSLLEKLYRQQKDLGDEIGYLEDYFPFHVKDYEGLIHELYGEEKDVATGLEEALAKARNKAHAKGQELDEYERERIISIHLRGYARGLGSKPGFQKERTGMKLEARMLPYYSSPVEALFSYIDRAVDRIEAKKFFGPYAVIDTAYTIESDGKEFAMVRVNEMESISAMIGAMLENGQIQPRDVDTVKRLLESRFKYQAAPKWVQRAKTFTYMALLNDVAATITQSADLAWAIYLNPVRVLPNLAKAVVNRSDITVEDIGVERIGQEFENPDKLFKSLDWMFRKIGFNYLDRVGKEVLMNSGIERLRKHSRKGKLTGREKEILVATFGNMAPMVEKELAEGKYTDDVKLLAFLTLADFQPISVSEMPAFYATSGAGRLFYTLKSFTLKQLDTFRRETIDEFAKGNVAQGTKNLILLSLAFYLSNTPVDWFKDWIYGRRTNLSDVAIDNIWKLSGLSRYYLYYAREEGPVSLVFARIMAPALPWIEYPFKDVNTMIDKFSKGEDIQWEDFESVRMVPFIGKFLYWHTGKGKAKTERRLEREKKEKK